MDTLVNLFAAQRETGESRQAIEPVVDRHANSLLGVRILLAEDNEINQQIAVELLEGVGASVDVANDGLEAVDKMLSKPAESMYDVVLMDVQMPRMDGYEATQRLRSEPQFTKLPIIAMTAHATLDQRQKCIEAGMDSHVSKPIDPAALFDTVRRFVQPRASAPIAPATHSTPVEAPLPQVEGLDTVTGLARMAGNKKLYWKLLSQFAATQGDAAQQIGTALKANDHVLAERLAHTVKGVAGNLGASSIQYAAANLEKAIAASSAAHEMELLCASLDTSISQLLAGLQPLLPRAEEPSLQTAEGPQLDSVIEQLSRYLAESDSRALEYFESEAPQLRSYFTEGKFEILAALIESYSFPEALDQLVAANESSKERLRRTSGHELQ